MIYDFKFSNTSEDAPFFLYILALEAKTLDLEVFFCTYEDYTHCFVPDMPSLLASYENYCQQATIPSAFAVYKDTPTQTEVIVKFANTLAQNLPLSLYFCFRDLSPITLPQAFFTALSQMPSLHRLTLKDIFALSLTHLNVPHNATLVDSKTTLSSFETPKTYYYTAMQTRQILNPKSASFSALNPPNFSPHKPLALPEKDYFTRIVQRLKNTESVPFCTQRGTFLLSLAPLENTHTTLLCDIASLKTFFRTHQSQVDVLATFEKPYAKLMPKEVFQKHFPLDEQALVRVGLPYDMPLAIIGALLLQDDISYFFLSPTQGQSDFNFCHSSAPSTQILNISQNGTIIDTYISPNNTLQSLLEAHTQGLERYLLIYLSTRHPSVFAISHNQTLRALLDITFERNAHLIVQDIKHSYKSGSDLIESFSKHSPKLLESILALPLTSHISHNLTDVLDVASFVLGFSPIQDKNALFARANAFVRERGPRIDYKLLRKDNAIMLDYNRIFRSCLSFKCADMEDEILAYGILDSLSEFVATLIRDTKTNLSLTNVLLLGDMLSSHIFLDRTLGYLPKDIHLILPKDGFIDY
ncbi:hypothetical protein LS71_007130 [Helicobacter jaachi]|uniref:Protein hydE n=1 Tax=Helicobacter jaachi TaxID=1677920 RepID=A0A4U8T956_9HELI|nr:hypothetical protein [Helicobacter jaachi]TLD96235.1 hypothetical protein LS71_007130 [Helicobacter jaachi]